MQQEANLTISQVANIVGVHRNTVLNYETKGYVEPMRDNNNFRRYSLQEALKLKRIVELRKPGNE